MIVAWLLAVVLFGLCGVLHARAMAFAMNFTDRNDIIGMHGLVVALYVLATAHVAEAGLYAIGFILGEWIGIGGFEQENVNSVMDFFYFSVVN